MKRTLAIPETLSEELLSLTQMGVESAGVLLANVVPSSDGGFRLLATELLPVPENAYVVRKRDRLTISSDGYIPALAIAEESESVPIWFHTHVGIGSSPRPSQHDEIVDVELSELFRIRSASEFYGSLVLSSSEGCLSFSGHLESKDGISRIDRLLTVGAHWTLSWHDELSLPPLKGLYDRNVRAFGGEVQQVLNDLSVAVVGCGGTGSAVAEQLVRLGVRHLTLIDGDKLSDSNTTRVFGSTPADVGAAKVDVLGDHLLRVAPDLELDRRNSMITVERQARALCEADLIFGCTDDNAGRLILSRLSTYMLIPVIDCGVILSNDERGRLNGIFGRITVLHPGAACLFCRNRIDVVRAGSEMMTPNERIRLTDEGYAPALVGIEPAVITFTTLVAATAVSELVERLTGYGCEVPPSEILLRIHDREMSANEQFPMELHYCDPNAHKIGLGLTDPLLDLAWVS